MLLVLLLPGSVLQAHAAGSGPLLPDLVADPPDGVSLATDSSTGTTRLLLRFNGYIHNKGPGALDFRGSRVAPKLSKETELRVKEAEEKKEGLPQPIEEELAASPMRASQRLFTTREGEEETNIERSHVDEASAAELIFSSADGHHHWHLQHAAKYSLWNAAKTAEVAPAQKVGFCLDDSQHVESKGPSTAVYADSVPPYRDFCQQYRPNATSLFEGISPGWRDLYDKGLAFQWVDASNVLPGEYWLREEVNPLNVIKETGGANVAVFAGSATTIPGFDALAEAASTQSGEAKTINLTVKSWSDSATPRYTIASQPQHGTLSAVSNGQVTYTPAAGYSGTDSFTYSAADPNSPFPEHPAIATVSIAVASRGGGGGGEGGGGEGGGSTTPSLLVGDATSTYPVADQTGVGREEAFQFTAKSSGTVDELQFRTNGTANPGVTGVSLGIFAEGAGKPGAELGGATVSGEPARSSWVTASGLSVAVVGGTRYWLVALPRGTTGDLHFNVASLGTGNVESVAEGLSALTPEPSWETYNQGPAGFQALAPAGGGSGHETETLQPSVAIEGAPESMIVGTSIQLSALVSHETSGVNWSASAGSITAGGLYTAPSSPPAGGSATIVARTAGGAQDQRTIAILPAPPDAPAPSVPAPAAPSGGASIAGGGTAGYSVSALGVSRPGVMLIGRELLMTTVVTKAGRVRLSAYLGKRRLGSCAAASAAGRTFTCRLALGHRISLRARIRVLASLRVGGLILQSNRPAGVIPTMKMMMGPSTPMQRMYGSTSSRLTSSRFLCSPDLRRALAVAHG